ncbi:conserved Plasmodium protein, unknown function [Plasmodium ovale curtisi]|uniref:UBA domain-containing protein n=1 Tax=Plasmodium ovale curtisi TaxID=864141 RepID=A0A1A8VP63_PLAOA|nr:conserved Plasmodium protein, unknown function [Plasmodium ovale curtisi]
MWYVCKDEMYLSSNWYLSVTNASTTKEYSFATSKKLAQGGTLHVENALHAPIYQKISQAIERCGGGSYIRFRSHNNYDSSKAKAMLHAFLLRTGSNIPKKISKNFKGEEGHIREERVRKRKRKKRKRKKMDEQNKLIEQMLEFGYSKEISLKVIKKCGAKTIDEALNWIELTEENDYQEDIPFGEATVEGGNVGNASNVSNVSNGGNGGDNDNQCNRDKDTTALGGRVFPGGGTTSSGSREIKAKLTPEEAQKKAIELQKKIREKKLMKEKEEELLKERNRIAMAKEVQKRKEQIEEFERKKYIENFEKEKNEHKKEKEKQLELLRREYEAKFGIAYKSENEKKKNIDDLTENEKREEIAILLNNLKNKHKNKKNELVCSLNILKTYFSNIKNNILEKKFQKIKKENKIFVEKIKIYEEMINILLLVGFQDSAKRERIELKSVNDKAHQTCREFYVIKNYPNTYLLASAIKFIDLVIKNVNP